MRRGQPDLSQRLVVLRGLVELEELVVLELTPAPDRAGRAQSASGAVARGRTGLLPMPLSTMLTALILVALQSGWALTATPPREVGRIYWEPIPETEIWVRLTPEGPDGKPPLVNLVFHAFYPGRAERDPYPGLPRWPRGAPARLTVSAEPLPLTVVQELSVQLAIDGRVVDLTGPKSRYRTLPCLGGTIDCTPNAVEAELEPSILRAVVTARSVEGRALGFPIKLVAADQAAVGDFLARVGLAENQGPNR